MKSWIKVGLLALLVAGVAACEKDPPEDENYQSEFTGTWNVLEKTGLNSPQSYLVEISAGATENDILIKGLYNHPAVILNAELFGLNLSIPNQTSDSISFSGSGQANVDFDQVTINFSANDGTGADEVKAILTPN